METKETRREIRRLINSLPKGIGIVKEVKQVTISGKIATIKAIEIDNKINYLGLDHENGNFFLYNI